MVFRLPQRDEPVRISVLLLIAVSYFAAGEFGLLLAIPPGYATAIWPSSGIALGCLLLWGSRYWYGVFLGSLCINLLASYDATSNAAILRSLMLATSIAGGAAFQAAIGAKLIRRFVDFPTTLTRERDVLGFFIIGGPITHLINATWGCSALLIAGAIPAAALAQNWWTWWVGDTIGALIFAPLIVMWLNTEATWSSRRTVVTVPLAVTFLAAVFLFIFTSRSEWQHLEQRFSEDTNELANAVTKRVDLNIETLHSVGALLTANQTVQLRDNRSPNNQSRDNNASNTIDPELFARFTGAILARHTELQALVWAPRDTHHQLDTQRDEHFPIQLIAPSDGNSNGNISSNNEATHNITTLGFDIASNAQLLDAMQSAFDRNQVTATAPITLEQAPGDRSTLLLALPVYGVAGAESLPINERRAQMRGYVLAVLKIPQLLSVALRDQVHASIIHIAIDDTTDARTPIRAYSSASNSIGTVSSNANSYTTLDAQLDAIRPARSISVNDNIFITVANRTWRLQFAPSLDYMATQKTPSASLVLAGGLLFTALIGIGALLVTGRAQAIETLVSHRTTELAQINEKLADEICDHLTTEHTLEKERELLKTVLNNLYEGILVLDTAGELRMANGVAYRMLRAITGEEVTELPKPRLFRMYAPDGETELLQEQTPHYCALRGQTVSDFEMVVQTPGRPAMTVIVNAQPLLTSDHQRHGAILVMRDITDRKEIERMKAEFVATVSHELRTPITSIRGSLGLIAGGVTGPLSEKTRSLVDIALRNSDRLAHLINDLLDMEKMESGKMQFELQSQSLGDLVEQAIESNAGYAQGCNVRFVLQTPVPAVYVVMDSFRLLQVMSNLLSNAAKFSPPQSIVEITLLERITANNRRIARVQVTDHGPGIPDEFRSRIFQKFSQADSSDARAKSGTGLGLVICKTIVEQMGGAIGYETQVGVGSTFYFELPVVASDAEIDANLAATGT